MRFFLSYRGKLRLKRAGIGLLCALLALILLAAGLVIYLGRYLVFTDEEAYFSFLHQEPSEEPSLQDPGTDFLGLEYGDPIARPDDEAQDPGNVQVSPDAIRGVYLSYSDLSDPSGCLAAIQATENCNTVLLQLKSNAGNFYYNSNFAAAISQSVDPSAVNELIVSLSEQGYYLIARVSAFPDSAWALENISSSLRLSSGALWMDADGYYWLDPADADVQQHLCSIALELHELGIDEVAFSDFYFPESENIAHDSDQTDRYMAISAAADLLIDLGAEHEFAVSFLDPVQGGPAPSAGGHLLFTSVEGSDAAQTQERYESIISGPQSLIFLTDSRDTRFEPYGILRSIELE